MLSSADRDLSPVADFFSGLGIEVGFIVPTETGLKKSILDATETFRAFLKFQDFHDYSLQSQGQASKKIVEAGFVRSSGVERTKASLYRPETKSGDPRVWFYSLPSYVVAGNLLACFVVKGRLLVLNTSDPILWKEAKDPESNVGRTICSARAAFQTVEMELLEMLRGVSSRGWHQTVRAGPTGVGATLEHLLGIAANSSRNPDYKGIEIKASRHRNKKRGGLQTLFSKTPEWKLSPINSARNLLATHGYVVDGRKQIYCTINASGTSNGLGYNLEVDENAGVVVCCRSVGGSKLPLMVWPLDALRSSLRDKHGSTVWVGAEVSGFGDQERFRYYVAEFTIAPAVSQLSDWIGRNLISLDLTLSDKGGGNVRDHGYLFRCHRNVLSKIFSAPDVYHL